MSATCYDENGISTDNIPCDPNAEVSACCGSGSVCGQNLYCEDPWGANVPGTCTQQDWGSNPSQFCPCHPRYVGNNTLNYLDSVTFCDDGSYCCGNGNDDCCNNGEGWAIIDYGNTATIPSTPTGRALSTYYEDTDVTTSSIFSTSIDPRLTTSSPIASSGYSQGTGSTSSQIVSSSLSAVSDPTITSHPSSSHLGAAMSADPTSTLSSASQAATSQADSGLSTGAKAGIGLGIALGVVGLLAFAIVLYLLRRRSTAKRAELPDSSRVMTFAEKTAPAPSPHYEPVSELVGDGSSSPVELPAR